MADCQNRQPHGKWVTQMSLFNALRDLADGVSRGLGLFITERNDFTEKVTTPGVYTRKR